MDCVLCRAAFCLFVCFQDQSVICLGACYSKWHSLCDGSAAQLMMFPQVADEADAQGSTITNPASSPGIQSKNQHLCVSSNDFVMSGTDLPQSMPQSLQCVINRFWTKKICKQDFSTGKIELFWQCRCGFRAPWPGDFTYSLNLKRSRKISLCVCVCGCRYLGVLE